MADPGSVKHFNSAVLAVNPERGRRSPGTTRCIAVIFGEYIPLKEALPFLRSFGSLWMGISGSKPDSEAKVFRCKNWHLVPLICFEDTVPHLVRGIIAKLNHSASAPPVDCLVNLTNDGWFHGSSGLDQHLITRCFAASNAASRWCVPSTRGSPPSSTATEIVVEPDVYLDVDNKGRTTMRDPKTGRWNRQLNAVLVDSVPLDNRTSLYLRYGDWFAGACGFAALLVLLASLVPRRWLGRAPPQPTIWRYKVPLLNRIGSAVFDKRG